MFIIYIIYEAFLIIIIIQTNMSNIGIEKGMTKFNAEMNFVKKQ